MHVRRVLLVLLAVALFAAGLSMLQPWHRFESLSASPLAFYQGPDVHLSAAERARLVTRAVEEHDGLTHHSPALFLLACGCALVALLALPSRRLWSTLVPSVGALVGAVVAAMPVFCLERSSLHYVAESFFRYAWYTAAGLALALLVVAGRHRTKSGSVLGE